MKTSRFLLLALVCACLASSGLGETPAQRARRWKSPKGLAEILMNHRDAQGLGAYGREKLRGLDEIRVTRRVTRSGAASYSDSCAAKEPDRIRMESAGTLVINTATFRIESDPNGELNRRAPAKYSDSVIAMCMINPSKSATVEKVRMVGRERLNGKATYHLIAMDDVGNYDEWLDARDYTLVQRKQSGVILSTTEEWSDFRNISGLMVPFQHSTRNTSTLNPWTEEETLTKLDFDPQLPDSDFTVEAATRRPSQPAVKRDESGTTATAKVGDQDVTVDTRSGTASVTAEEKPAQQGSMTANIAAMPVIRKVGQGQIVSPACSDATNHLTVFEERLEPSAPDKDMRVTITNTSLEDLWVERVNCGEGGKLRPAESRRCVYGSKTGWAMLAAKYRDVRDAADAKVNTACGAAFDAAAVLANGRVPK
jgi:hypothetical protein